MSGSQRLGEFSFFRTHPNLLNTLARTILPNGTSVLTVAALNDFVDAAARSSGVTQPKMPDSEVVDLLNRYSPNTPTAFYARPFIESLFNACRYDPFLRKARTQAAWDAEQTRAGHRQQRQTNGGSQADIIAPFSRATAPTDDSTGRSTNSEQPVKPRERRGWIERPKVFSPPMLNFLESLRDNRQQWVRIEAAVAADINNATILSVEGPLRNVRQGRPFKKRNEGYELTPHAIRLVDQLNATLPENERISPETAYSLDAFLKYEQAATADAAPTPTHAVLSP